ncbi:MAG: DUF2075 domain-containing protein [Thomasclavelia sp.]|nr:DUF2075 domain-containing protein [Thomasclavelia sp.]
MTNYKSKIDTFDFNKDDLNELLFKKYGQNWPIVYVINNDKEAYIGESQNAYNRMKNHLDNAERKKLKKVNIIHNDSFNKSAILDIESLLIQYFGADNKYKLQNGNSGQSQSHDYYQRQKYINEVPKIWKLLADKQLVISKLAQLENSDLFKYSPYKSLTPDQYTTANDIINDIAKCAKNNERRSFIVNGSAGTGKTILAMYLIKTIYEGLYRNVDASDLEENDDDNGIIKSIEKLKTYNNGKPISIGFVVPMVSLRNTLKKVLRGIKKPSKDAVNPSSIIIGPNDVCKKKYDLLIVDEAHRLTSRKGITNYKAFDDINRSLGFDNSGTQLDWVMKCSKYQILFYDKKQSIRPADIDKKSFEDLIELSNSYSLTTQMRVAGGNEYIQFINNLFSNKLKTNKKMSFKDYDFKLYNDVDQMIKDIKKKDKELDLCRNIAGYSWPWKTKGKSYKEITTNNLYDIEIQGHKYFWNTENDWINSKHAIDEIGCIHKVQGYDLNYTGLIIGNDLSYDFKNNKFIVNKDEYYDTKGKVSIKDDNELLEYIINIYKIILTRGIKGTYIYVCDDELRKYFEQFIETQKQD